jgi:Fe-S-cluster containining protein
MRRVELDLAPAAWPLCVSAVEKVLLKRGFVVADWFDNTAGAQMTRAADPFTRFAVHYVKPAYWYPAHDRAEELDRVLFRLAAHWGMRPEQAAETVRRELATPPEEFSCVRCGDCCSRFGDAYRGRVTVEEVDWWRELELDWLLRFVRQEKRLGYSFFRAWVHPKTGEYLNRCPWLRPARGNQPAGCRIHPVRPLKCRAFPLNLEHAQRAGCPGAGAGARPRPIAPKAA